MRSVSRPGRNRSLRPSVLSPCNEAHSTSVRVSTSCPSATSATASRSSANAALNWMGVSSAANRNPVAGEHRVVEHRVLGGEAAVCVGDPAQRLIPSAGTVARGLQGLGKLAEALQCDSLHDVLHRPLVAAHSDRGRRLRLRVHWCVRWVWGQRAWFVGHDRLGRVGGHWPVGQVRVRHDRRQIRIGHAPAVPGALRKHPTPPTCVRVEPRLPQEQARTGARAGVAAGPSRAVGASCEQSSQTNVGVLRALEPTVMALVEYR